MAIQRADIAGVQAPNTQGQSPIDPNTLTAPAQATQAFGKTLMDVGHKMAVEEAKIYSSHAEAKWKELATETENNLSKKIDPRNPQYRSQLKEALASIKDTYLRDAPNKIARSHLEERFKHDEGQMLARGVLLEDQAKVGYLANLAQDTLNTLKNTVETNGELFGSNLAQGLALIQNNDVFDANQKQQMAQQFKSDIRQAQLQGQMRSSPDQVYNALLAGTYDHELLHAQKEQLIHAAGSRLKTVQSVDSMLRAHQQGVPLLLDHSQKDIDTLLYNDLEAKQVAAQDGQPLSPYQYGQMVGEYRTPSSRMDFKMTQAVLYGKPEEMAAWVEVYKGLSDPDNGAPQALTNLSQPVRDKLSIAKDFLSQSPELGPVAASEFATRVTRPEFKDQYEGRLREARANKKYQGENFQKALAEAMGMKPAWWKFQGDGVQQLPVGLTYRAQETFYRMSAAYELDPQTALRNVADQLSQTFGPNPIDPDGPWIELPPNRVLPGENANGGVALKNQFAFAVEDFVQASQKNPGAFVRYELAPQDKRSDALSNVQGELSLGKGYKKAVSHGQRQDIPRQDPRVLDTDIFGKQLPEIMIEGRPRQVYFGSDEQTRNAPLGQLSYPLYYFNERGIKCLLNDPTTNTPARWYVQPTHEWAAPILEKQKRSTEQAAKIVEQGTKNRNDLIQHGLEAYSPAGVYKGEVK